MAFELVLPAPLSWTLVPAPARELLCIGGEKEMGLRWHWWSNEP